MKALILSSKLPYPPKDGGAIGTLNLSTGIALAGIEVTMLAINTVKHFFPLDNIPDHLSDKIAFKAVRVDTAIKWFPALINLLFSSEPYISERFKSDAYASELKRLLKENTYDFVQLEGPYMHYYIPLIRQYSKAKIVLRAHNVEYEIWEQNAQKESGLIKKIYLRILAARIKRLETKIMFQIDGIVAVSEQDCQLLTKNNPDLPGIIVPAFINIKDYNPSASGNDKDIFFIGALDWMPNLEGISWFIKEVFPSLILALPKLRLHIAGRNAPPEILELTKHPAIIYHGEVEDAKKFMDEHGLMIVPLLTGSGIRIKILEGMAMGKCIVSSSIGADGIPLSDQQNILLADQADSFREKIIELLNNKSLQSFISKNARSFIQENFDTFAVASKLKAFYKKLV